MATRFLSDWIRRATRTEASILRSLMCCSATAVPSSTPIRKGFRKSAFTLANAPITFSASTAISASPSDFTRSLKIMARSSSENSELTSLSSRLSQGLIHLIVATITNSPSISVCKRKEPWFLRKETTTARMQNGVRDTTLPKSNGPIDHNSIAKITTLY